MNKDKVVEIYIRLGKHLNESYDYFKQKQIVGIFLQGSQNYNLDLPESDVDTKLLVIPEFKDLALNKKAISTTHIRENEEHTDWKDIRLAMNTFRKQNLNFSEILFTDYFWVSPLYAEQWNRLVEKREEIVRMNPVRAVKSMYGLALTKYKNIERFHPTHAAIFEHYKYNPKEVSHLVRIRDYLDRYIAGEDYKSCMTPKGEMFDLIMDLKVGKYSLEDVRKIADENITHIEKIAFEFEKNNSPEENQEMVELLEDVLYNIMEISVREELK